MIIWTNFFPLTVFENNYIFKTKCQLQHLFLSQMCSRLISFVSVHSAFYVSTTCIQRTVLSTLWKIKVFFNSKWSCNMPQLKFLAVRFCNVTHWVFTLLWIFSCYLCIQVLSNIMSYVHHPFFFLKWSFLWKSVCDRTAYRCKYPESIFTRL